MVQQRARAVDTSPDPGVAPSSVLACHIPATPAVLPGLRHTVLALAEQFTTDTEILGDISRAVTEALANVVVHAYEPGVDGLVHVVADAEDDAVEVLISDDGLGFRAGESPGTGLGLALIAASSARFEINRRDPAGTEIWLRFELDR